MTREELLQTLLLERYGRLPRPSDIRRFELPQVDDSDVTTARRRRHLAEAIGLSEEGARDQPGTSRAG